MNGLMDQSITYGWMDGWITDGQMGGYQYINGSGMDE